MFDTSMQLLDADIPKDLNEAKEKLKEGLIDYARFVFFLPLEVSIKLLDCFSVAAIKARRVGVLKLCGKVFIYWQGIDFVLEKIEPASELLAQLF